jgi:Divergent InlB B-repeat domain
MRANFYTLLIVPLFFAIPVVLAPSLGTAHGHGAPLLVRTQVVGGTGSQLPYQRTGFVPPPSAAPSSSSDPVYDEQLGLTFTQSFSSMLYEVTAVKQTDPSSGEGPAYLLQGLSNEGYWYQVGLTYNWGNTNGGYSPGFQMLYEVFDSNGNSIFPSNGAGLLLFSGVVYQGDSVALNLYFSNSGQVVMLAEDQNTGAYASESYSGEGATHFTGSPFSTGNPVGFFTGLMTEWYHPNAFYENEARVTYSSSLAISSGWMWADEFSCPDASCSSRALVFSDSTSSSVSYTTSPNDLQGFSSNGATEYSDAYEFITGYVPLEALTLSYAVQGGGFGYSPPTVDYYQLGVLHSYALNGVPTTFVMDIGSQWSLSDILSGSTADERWETPQPTGGVVATPQTINFVYYHQFHFTTSFSVVDYPHGVPPTLTSTSLGAALTAPVNTFPTGYWLDVGAKWNISTLLSGSNSSERWIATLPTSGTVSTSESIALEYLHQFYVVVQTSEAGGGVLTPTAWYNATSSLDLSAKASPGWQFEGWAGEGVGSYSGGLNSSVVTVSSAIIENATFYPGLVLIDGGNGQISYSWGQTHSDLQSGSTAVFVPQGTSVSLAATPSSVFFVFQQYIGDLNSSKSASSVVVSAPEVVSASFARNYPVIGGVAGAVGITCAGVLYYFIRMRPKAKLARPSVSSGTHTVAPK